MNNMKKTKGPGKSQRKGISLIELFDIFPDEKAARQWLEEVRWPSGEQYCPHCGCTDRIKPVPNDKPMPYRCSDCRKYFSVRTGTCMERSHISLQKWVIAMYLLHTNLKGVAAMKLKRDLKISYPSSWFLAHRIRESWREGRNLFSGTTEVDETYIGGKEKNKRFSKKLKSGRGPVGKTAVVGAKNRDSNQVKAKVVDRTTKDNLQGFVRDRVNPGSTVYTDEHRSYFGLHGDYRHKAVQHKIKQFVEGQAHTNGIESFWSLLKRGYTGTYHRMSPKHLQRYIDEFSGRHNARLLNTIDQMALLFRGMIGKRLMYRDLIAD